MGGYFLNEGCLRTMLIENLKEKKQLRKCIYSLQTNITKWLIDWLTDWLTFELFKDKKERRRTKKKSIK